MDNYKFFEFIEKAEKLKCNTRHSYTSTGRKESVAEHCYSLSLMLLLLKNDFPNVDMGKAIKLAIVHDLGEAITGDIPAFYKTGRDEQAELAAVKQLLGTLPSPEKEYISDLYQEFLEQRTIEARLVKAFDKLDAVTQHNIADISTWIELEYELNLTYGENECSAFEKTKSLKDTANEITKRKLLENQNNV